DRMQLSVCFFFQAEDGIRDWSVTGVQTCALPISRRRALYRRLSEPPPPWTTYGRGRAALIIRPSAPPTDRLSSRAAPGDNKPARSEERRVGKERRCRWGGDTWKRERWKRVERREV